MTRLRLLEEETTKPKDKQDIRYKNCSSDRGGRTRKQQITIKFNDELIIKYLCACPLVERQACNALKARKSR